MVSTPVVLTLRPRRLRLLEAHSGVQSSPIKEAAAQAGSALTATVQAGVVTKEAAAQAGAALSTTASAGAMTKGAAAQAGAALTATVQAGAMTKGAAAQAAQAGAALTATAQAGALPKGARALASDAEQLVWPLSSRLVAIPPAAFKKLLRRGRAAF